MKKLLALALVLLMGASLFAACEKNEVQTGELIVNACINSEPETIDPTLISSVDGSTYTLHQFENLMKYQIVAKTAADDKNVQATEVVPGQAAGYSVSEDELTYTFTLRDDIKWSDGKPVTAKDWVYSWRRLVDPKTAAEYGYFLDGIVLNAADIQAGLKDATELGIKADGDKTLIVTLESPCSYFLEMCAFAPLVPLREDVIEASDRWTDPANIVVNGAYKLVEWVHDSKLVMEKNDKYYDYENLGPKQIVWWLSESATAILSSYQSGEYQFVENFAPDMISTMRANGDCFINPYVGTYFLYLNCSRIPDWHVRAAMVLSIDRDNIVKNVTQGGESPASGFVASGIFDSTGSNFAFGRSDLGPILNALKGMYPDADLATYPGRCALAKKLYAEAVDSGHWDPAATIVYNYNTDEANKAIAEACGSDWQTVLGMKVTLENQEWQTYASGLSEHSFDVARLVWVADYNDPITYLELLVTGNSYNYGLYSDPEYDELIAKAKDMTVGTARDSLLYTAEEMLFREGAFPVCPIHYDTNVYCAKGISNIGYTPMGFFFFTYAKAAND